MSSLKLASGQIVHFEALTPEKVPDYRTSKNNESLRAINTIRLNFYSMKVVTLTDKEEKILVKLIDKKMKNMHDKYIEKEKDLTDSETIRHNKKMARLSGLKDKVK